jgi:hypothetical protein
MMTSWALVVAINEYPAETSLRKLKGAVADAADFADWLLNPLGGNVAKDHLFFWTHPAPVDPGIHLTEYMENPTRWPKVGPEFDRPPEAIEIIRFIPELAKRSVGGKAERLYVFFAGHGAQKEPTAIYEEDPQNCFIAADYHPDLLAAGLVGMDNLRRFLTIAGPSELVLFFDCCRDKAPLKVGSILVPYNVQSPKGLHKQLGIGRAAQPGAVAYEVPMGQTGLTRGVFSKLLVGALREHRVNGQLTLKDLEDFVNAGIPDLVKPNVQVPDFDEKPRVPALVLTKGPPLNTQIPLLVKFETLAAGAPFELRDAWTSLIAQANVEADGNSFDLPIGSYSIEDPTAQGDDRVLAVFNHIGPESSHVVA